ncbi:MAG: putative acetyltransferase [Firmicutes bacterium ADurb.Bin419]|nr:MAG: putative acetyltransferase [Firmicutes bacterium ADurb.Bin419]
MTIEDNVFIGAGTIVLPGVTIGKNTVIGAGNVIAVNIPENSEAVGNPAKVLCSCEEIIEERRKLMEATVIYDECYTVGAGVTKEKKPQMQQELLRNRRGVII